MRVKLKSAWVIGGFMFGLVSGVSGCDTDPNAPKGGFSLQEAGPLAARVDKKEPDKASPPKRPDKAPVEEAPPAMPVAEKVAEVLAPLAQLDQEEEEAPQEKAEPRKKAPLKPAVELPSQAKTRRLARKTSEPGEPSAAGIAVRKMAVAKAIENRSPVGVANRFDTSVDKLWAYVGLQNKTDASHITMVWKKNGKPRSRVKLKIGKSDNWRTWSSKKIDKGDAGQWVVEIQDPEGHVLESVNFKLDAPAG